MAAVATNAARPNTIKPKIAAAATAAAKESHSSMKLISVKHLLQILILLPLAGVAAPAAWSSPQAKLRQQAATVAAIGKSGAADVAQKRHGGTVLKVEEINTGGKTAYRVKLLLDGGRIKIVIVDASGGAA